MEKINKSLENEIFELKKKLNNEIELKKEIFELEKKLSDEIEINEKLKKKKNFLKMNQ